MKRPNMALAVDAKVQSAQIVEYATSSEPWRAIQLVRPNFDAIEAALRRLDGDLRPSLGLFLGIDPAADAVPDFEVLGGHQGYYVQANAGGGTSSYYNNSAPSMTITVWVSDQGAEMP